MTAQLLPFSRRPMTWVQQVTDSRNTVRLQRIRRLVDSFCGIYSRVARRLGVDRTYVSRVAKGERHSPDIERALIQDFQRVQLNEPEET